MKVGRREFVIASGTALLLSGCQSAQTMTGGLPVASWPDVEPPEVPHSPPREMESLPHSTVTTAMPKNTGTPGNPIPRSAWTNGSIMKNINPMRGIQRITVHHEGWKVVGFSDYSSTAARLELVRRSHVNRKFADIGYHYIIDRAGRMYEGRPLQFQGAHVRDNNEHNLGIMCLGNFEHQQPTDAQLRTLRSAVAYFRRKYNINTNRVYSHRELVSTTCPGRHLQSHMNSLRG